METISQLPITNEIASVIWAKKCAADRGFLTKIRADVATAFEGSTLPPSMQVRAVQNTADTLDICVPDYRGLNDAAVNELRDEQMAGVSGGLFFLFGLLGLVGTAGTVGAAATAGAGLAAAGGAMIAEAQQRPEGATGG